MTIENSTILIACFKPMVWWLELSKGTNTFTSYEKNFTLSFMPFHIKRLYNG